MTTETTTPSGLELLRGLADDIDAVPNIGRMLGMRIDRVDAGEVAMSMETRPDFANPMGSVHGGICATLLDSVMSCAVHTTLEPGVGYSTLELKVNYVATVATDDVRLSATGRTVHVGRTTATAEGFVHDQDGRMVAHGTAICLILRGRV